MNTRVKELRKNYLKLTLKEFGLRIGLSTSSISDIENGRVNLTERNIKAICEKFNVNEEWLRNGIEPIFNICYTNMNIVERLIFLRKSILKLTQKEFGEKIGLKQTSYSEIENLRSNLTERNIKAICEKFNVNEEWLHKGTEPILIKKKDEEKLKDTEKLVDLIQKELNLSPLAKKIVTSYLNLDKDDRVVFEKFFENLINEIINDDTVNLDVKPQLKLIGFGGDNQTKELDNEQDKLNDTINNDNKNNEL